ncbi:MAG: hypothetical protein IJD78_04420 [Clostridia bacterium]|nr:hypothetical protein [Clostridia bacterium]
MPEHICEPYKSELAYNMFMSLGAGFVDPEYKRAIEKQKEYYPTRNDMLFKIIDLIGYPETVKEKYTFAYAYYWLGSKYCTQAITHLCEYIKSGCLPDNGKRYVPEFDLYIESKHNLASAYHDLGVSCERNYQFEEAMKCYIKAARMQPFYSHHYVVIARLCAKLNDLDRGIRILTKVAESNEFYQLSKRTETHSFKKAIDFELKDLLNKKEQGYVYRPRKRNRDV